MISNIATIMKIKDNATKPPTYKYKCIFCKENLYNGKYHKECAHNRIDILNNYLSRDCSMNIFLYLNDKQICIKKYICVIS
jgi:hypothetical protein